MGGWLRVALENAEEQLAAYKAGLPAKPTPEQKAWLWELQRRHDHALKKASDAYDRECEADYAAQWASWAYGPDV